MIENDLERELNRKEVIILQFSQTCEVDILWHFKQKYQNNNNKDNKNFNQYYYRLNYLNYRIRTISTSVQCVAFYGSIKP